MYFRYYFIFDYIRFCEQYQSVLTIQRELFAMKLSNVGKHGGYLFLKLCTISFGPITLMLAYFFLFFLDFFIGHQCNLGVSISEVQNQLPKVLGKLLTFVF